MARRQKARIIEIMQNAHNLKLSSEAIRVLGVLLEKEFTTPDNYPLTLNSLVSGCNQTTNRFPIVDFDEMTVERGLTELREKGLALRGVYAGSRVPKHRHNLNERLKISLDGLAVLTVLFLRGDQTLGEIKLRTERMVQFSDLGSCDLAVTELVEFDPQLATRIGKEPGQKEGRVSHCLAEEDFSSGQKTEDRNILRPSFQLIDGELQDREIEHETFEQDESLENRVKLLEKEVTVLTHEIMSLRAEIDQITDPSA